MFKKKHNIPPRPKPPVAEQVLHDLNTAPEDDIVFMRVNSTSGKRGSVRSRRYLWMDIIYNVCQKNYVDVKDIYIITLLSIEKHNIKTPFKRLQYQLDKQ
jgi:hypothetical protein